MLAIDMPYPEEVARNKLIAKLYKPHKHGYKQLGKEFKLDWTTVRDIVKREQERERLGKTQKNGA